MKIAIPYIATGPYIALWSEFYESAKNYLLPGKEKHFFLLTDSKDYEASSDVTVIPIEHKPWPYATLQRYGILLSIAKQLAQYDVAMFFNGNVKFLKECGQEFIPGNPDTLKVVRHILNTIPSCYPYEKNGRSMAYVQPSSAPYIAGGFLFGYTKQFLALAEEIDHRVRVDLSKGIVPIWHDESYLNSVFHNMTHVFRFSTLSEEYCNTSTNIPDKVLVLRDKASYFDVDEFKNQKTNHKNA